MGTLKCLQALLKEGLLSDRHTSAVCLSLSPACDDVQSAAHLLRSVLFIDALNYYDRVMSVIDELVRSTEGTNQKYSETKLDVSLTLHRR